MKSKTAKALVGFGIFAVCQTSSASFLSSTRLMQILEEDMRGSSSYAVGVASGYVMGVHDMSDGILVCTPAGVTFKQVKQVVFNYMKDKPEQWANSADVTIIKALASVWPCEKSR